MVRNLKTDKSCLEDGESPKTPLSLNLSISTPISKAAILMDLYNEPALPVKKEEKVIGIVTKKDIGWFFEKWIRLPKNHSKPSHFLVAEVLNPRFDTMVVSSPLEIRELTRFFLKNKLEVLWVKEELSPRREYAITRDQLLALLFLPSTKNLNDFNYSHELLKK